MARRKLRNLDARILKKTIYYGALLGIDEISTKKIAEDIGITEPTIYVHFRTRANLLFEANSAAVKKIGEEFLSGDMSLSERFRLALMSAKNNPEAVLYAFYYRQKNLSDEFDHLFDEFFRKPTAAKDGVIEGFLYRVATGSVAVTEEVAEELFDLVRSL